MIFKRTYHIHVPETYPLVFVFHMRMGNAWMMQKITHFNRLANQNQFIVVYPDGFRRSWADGSQRYEADQAGIDDNLFMRILLSSLQEQFYIDEMGIFAAGFSNGGFLVHRIGCELSSQITVIATVSAVFAENVLQECNPERKISVLMMHGSAERDMGWEGKYPDLASVPATLEKWLDINQCSDQAAIERYDTADDETKIEILRYSDCEPEVEVIFYKIEGGGYKWPSGNRLWQYWLSGNYSEEIDASAVIWEFFETKTND